MNKIFPHFIFIILLLAFSFQIAYAGNDSSADSGEAQGQQSFPFDKECLKFDKANFKAGPALLDLMQAGDFPQYCVLYSLSNYQVKQKTEDGYFIVGSKLDQQHAQETTVFLKSQMAFNPVGQWAYFVGPEDIVQENGSEKEIYVFKEINF